MESFVEELGIAFLTDTTYQTDEGFLLIEPQLTFSEGLSNIEGWTEIQLSFIAKQPYQYFIIGNFRRDNETILVKNPNASNEVSTYGAYYFIDEVFIEQKNISNIRNIESPQFTLSTNLTSQSVELKTQFIGNKRIDIYNTKGELVKRLEYNLLEYNLNVTDWQGGIYFIHLSSTEGKYLGTRKLMVID